MAKTHEPIEGFILTRHWVDRDNGIELQFWLATDSGPVLVTVADQEAVFFIRQTDRARLQPILGLQRGWRVQDLSLKNYYHQPVSAVYFASYKRARDAAQLLRRQLPVWEADIRPPDRFLMERFIKSAVEVNGAAKAQLLGQDSVQHWQNPSLKSTSVEPNFRVVSVDIETDMRAHTLYSIAVYAADAQKVFMIGEPPQREENNSATVEVVDEGDIDIDYCATETECLQRFLTWIQQYDPDVLIGWNFIGFDLWVLTQMCRRLAIEFAIGRLGAMPSWRQDPSEPERRYITIPGRVALDGIELLRAAFYQFESFSLQFVAGQLLGDSKLVTGGDRGDEITRLFEQDKPQLARYNLKDCELVWEIFNVTQLLEFASSKSQMTGLPLDRIGGSAASFEFSYLPRLHRQGYVGPNIGDCQVNLLSPGGYVLESVPGLFRQVLVFDFKSLYPSIIRTFNIDPFAFWYAEHQQLTGDDIIDGFNGAKFCRDRAILPTMIAELWQSREVAKQHNNQPLSQAIKIIMNSFYGVLGSPLCRFHDPRIASSITLRGHEILQQTQHWFEEQGYQVIYGDTDSVFVWLGNDCQEEAGEQIGHELAVELNHFWQNHLKQRYGLSSNLEIQFETHFSQFYMPTIRGQEMGSKKRYAGLVKKGEKTEMIFRGLETVRSDWTPLARQFQREVFERVFSQREFKSYINQYAEQLMAGELDRQLAYRKRLRRPLDEYESISPPHVQAARKLREAGIDVRKGDWVEYVITVHGAEPLQLLDKKLLDYDHYLEKQLAPVVDGLLEVMGTSFQTITNRQIVMF